MGIPHSVARFLGIKTEESDQCRKHGDSTCRSSVVLQNLSTFLSSIYGAIQGLLQKSLFIFYQIADQIYWSISPTILSKDDDTSSAESPHADQELQSGEEVDVVSSANSDTEKEIIDHVIVSIPPNYSTDSSREEKNNNEIINNDLSSSETPSVMDELERWFKHYSSRHRILLVGEGDFSFSASLAVAFGSASNIIATSLDSIEFLNENYRNAPMNIEKLRSRGCRVMHEIDATQMAGHYRLGYLKFDRIIFNFPFAGFFKYLPRESQLRLHRRLVEQFLENAKEMISENGEIHITHKTNGFHREWNLESIASLHRLRLIEAVDFNLDDYPGYNTKRGFGGDDNFDCYPSKTYKFRLSGSNY